MVTLSLGKSYGAMPWGNTGYLSNAEARAVRFYLRDSGEVFVGYLYESFLGVFLSGYVTYL